MILVTGASGHVGGKALATLQRQGFRSAGMVRSLRKGQGLPAGTPFYVADYDDPESLRRAFQDASTLLFVSSDGEARDVLRQHANVIEAAAAQNVSSIIFAGILDIEAASPFYYTPVYRDAERRLRESGVGWTLLRCGLYADFVLEHWLKPASPSGLLALPVGSGRIAPIARDEVALAAATLAASPGQHVGKVYELTGRRALSFQEIAGVFAAATSAPLAFTPCSPSDYLRHAWAALEDPWPHAFSTLCLSIAEGRYQRVTEAYETLLGRPPTDIASFLRASAPAGPERDG